MNPESIIAALLLCAVFLFFAFAIRAGLKAYQRGEDMWGGLKKFLSFIWWHMP